MRAFLVLAVFSLFALAASGSGHHKKKMMGHGKKMMMMAKKLEALMMKTEFFPAGEGEEACTRVPRDVMVGDPMKKGCKGVSLLLGHNAQSKGSVINSIENCRDVSVTATQLFLAKADIWSSWKSTCKHMKV